MESRRVEVAPAGEAEHAAVRSFYASVGYGGGPAAAGRVIVARREGSIVAAARLSREDGTLVLRGMYVAEPLRGAGIGSMLLDRLAAEIGTATCWCIPYVHLVAFYSRIGFVETDPQRAPAFLVSRVKRYLAAGRDVTILRRPGAFARRGAGSE